MATNEIVVTVDTTEALGKIAKARAEVDKLVASQRAAEIRQATLQAQMEALTKKLQGLTDGTSWDDLSTKIGHAADNAQKAIQELTRALEEAGIDSE